VEGVSLFAEGVSLFVEGVILFAEGVLLFVEGVILFAKGVSLFVEGVMLFAKGFRNIAKSLIINNTIVGKRLITPIHIIYFHHPLPPHQKLGILFGSFRWSKRKSLPNSANKKKKQL
jgi:hypothetical protein